MIYLDTHVVAWLYAGLVERIPERVRRELGESELLISPMVRLELQYLYEIRRVTQPAAVVIDALRNELDLQFCEAAFEKVVEEAAKQSWTRDPFDRMIVAQAALRNSVLVTKDEVIHEQYAQALWA